MEVRTETICAYGGTCEYRKIYRTIHGPVIAVDDVSHLAFTIPGMNFIHYLLEAARKNPDIRPDVIDAREAWDHHYNDDEDPK